MLVLRRMEVGFAEECANPTASIGTVRYFQIDKIKEMEKESPLVNGQYLLEKFPGKGGWTYAAIPEVIQNNNNPFGWVKVRGSIDGFELKQYKLMPMGNKKLFLPVKAAIRKKIKKEAGNTVTIILYADESPLEIPNEIIECFINEPPKTYEIFMTFTEGEQKAYLNWIYRAKTVETKTNRILKMMDKLQDSLKFHDD